MSENIEEIYIKTLDAIRLTELAKISALTQTEIGGFIYGLKNDKKFYLKGIVPVYEKANSNEIDNQRTEMYIRMFKKSNPNYLFFQYHSHPNGLLELSPDDLELVDSIEVILSAEAEFKRKFLRRKVCRVGHGVIKAYKVNERKAKEIPIKILHSHKF